MARKKLVLVYVDSLRTDMLEAAITDGRAPTFGRLVKRGTLIGDCVAPFPSVTPVASAEMVTGVRADRHWISGMNWYHRVEQRYVEYGSSLDAGRAFGLLRSLTDLVYNMNLAHLSPEIETISAEATGVTEGNGATQSPISVPRLTRRPKVG
ncbi:MAG: alkaline phosphatase family protein, partial [Solirubrobacterales bacterium]